MSEQHFDDSDYIDRIFGNVSKNDDASPLKDALNRAHEIRKFEIGLFWTRGSYYWVFIAASFAAYFAVASKFLENTGDLLDFLVNLGFMQKIVLLILSFACFFFCLSWLLVNKGSKFWQMNWEAHIDRLENETSGRMYKAIVNTHEGRFSRNPLSKKAYDYSVSSVTTLTSAMLTVLSFALAVFHGVILFCKDFNVCEWRNVILLLAFVFIGYFTFALLRCAGTKENKGGSGKWFMRSGK